MVCKQGKIQITNAISYARQTEMVLGYDFMFKVKSPISYYNCATDTLVTPGAAISPSYGGFVPLPPLMSLFTLTFMSLFTLTFLGA